MIQTGTDRETDLGSTAQERRACMLAEKKDRKTPLRHEAATVPGEAPRAVPLADARSLSRALAIVVLEGGIIAGQGSNPSSKVPINRCRWRC